MAAAMLSTACRDDAEPPVIPNSPALSQAALPTGGKAGDGPAAIQAEPQNPGACSSTIHVSGTTSANFAAGQNFWIVVALKADPNWIHYPKARLGPEQGEFDRSVPANTEAGNRTERFLLISADAQSDAELERSQQSDELQDGTVTDDQRVRLPVGAHEIARAQEFVQRC
jgi:hypothetical protein